jgi:hypothetical protein
MQRALAAVAAIVISLSGSMQEQIRTPAQPAMELRLQVSESADGLPKSFVFELINVSEHDLRLPKPTTGCSDPYNGSLMLVLIFHPAPKSHSNAGGYGCFVDPAWEKVSERTAKWKVLHPGEVLRIIKTRAEMNRDDSVEPGTYEFWAAYTPPHVHTDEEKWLRDGGIEYPRTQLTSNHLNFEKVRWVDGAGFTKPL